MTCVLKHHGGRWGGGGLHNAKQTHCRTLHTISHSGPAVPTDFANFQSFRVHLKTGHNFSYSIR